MLQLVNLSDYSADLNLIHNDPTCLQTFLNDHHLDGLEMMFCNSEKGTTHQTISTQYHHQVQGVHLRFWPCWLDFWRGNQQELLRQFGSEAAIQACYGAFNREDWLNLYRENIRKAKAVGARYFVFHVGHARAAELFTWQFSASNREIIEATIEVVNELAADIPETIALLFENLWWPGLTLKDKNLTELLLARVNHRNSGIMLDTGHLMNTNQAIKTEAEGIDYILQTLTNLGSCRQAIRGIHLHKSLSGRYVKQSLGTTEQKHTLAEIMYHVLKIDQHLPFTLPAVQRIVELVQPEYLVHEFMQISIADWDQKVQQQQQALYKKS
jgi:hypothetical protein